MNLKANYISFFLNDNFPCNQLCIFSKIKEVITCFSSLFSNPLIFATCDLWYLQLWILIELTVYAWNNNPEAEAQWMTRQKEGHTTLPPQNSFRPLPHGYCEQKTFKRRHPVFYLLLLINLCLHHYDAENGRIGVWGE